jgi:uncharacterized protein involved in exopolysaccharide biosynthesis
MTRNGAAAQPTVGGAVVTAARRHPGLFRWPLAVIALLAVLGAALLGGIAAVYIASQDKTYTSESLVIVLSEAGTNGDVGPITAAWVEIATAPTVLDAAAHAAGVPPAELKGALTVSQPSSTPLLAIRMTTTNPERSADWANAVAAKVLEQSRRRPIEGFAMDKLTDAVAAPEPDADRSSLTVMLAAITGALAGGVVGRELVRLRAQRRSTTVAD